MEPRPTYLEPSTNNARTRLRRTTAALENDELTSWGTGEQWRARLAANHFRPEREDDPSNDRYRCTLCGRSLGKRSVQMAIRQREIARAPDFHLKYPGLEPEDVVRPSARNARTAVQMDVLSRFRGHRCPEFSLAELERPTARSSGQRRTRKGRGRAGGGAKKGER